MDPTLGEISTVPGLAKVAAVIKPLKINTTPLLSSTCSTVHHLPNKITRTAAVVKGTSNSLLPSSNMVGAVGTTRTKDQDSVNSPPSTAEVTIKDRDKGTGSKVVVMVVLKAMIKVHPRISTEDKAEEGINIISPHLTKVEVDGDLQVATDNC